MSGATVGELGAELQAASTATNKNPNPAIEAARLKECLDLTALSYLPINTEWAAINLQPILLSNSLTSLNPC
jgi:hypothetical protein